LTSKGQALSAQRRRVYSEDDIQVGLEKEALEAYKEEYRDLLGIFKEWIPKLKAQSP